VLHETGEKGVEQLNNQSPTCRDFLFVLFVLFFNNKKRTNTEFVKRRESENVTFLRIFRSSSCFRSFDPSSSTDRTTDRSDLSNQLLWFAKQGKSLLLIVQGRE